MNKQNIIDDYKQTIKRLQKECTEKTDLNIELTERVKELEKENERLKGWREIAHKKINELSQRVKNYIKCTNALTCEINDLKEENNHLTGVNKMVEKKLKIALNSLSDIATFDNYIVAQLDAQQALQKINEVKDDNNINLN